MKITFFLNKNNNSSSGDLSGDGKSESRAGMLQLLFVVAFIVFSARLFSMQVLSGDLYRMRAVDIARRTVVISSQRGEIYDRQFSRPLVHNTDSFAVFVTPAEIENAAIPGTLEKVSKILNIPLAQMERRLPPQSYSLFQPVEVASNISFATIAALAEQVQTLPGISWQSKPVRTYPETGSISHVIGYVGDITRDELTVMYNEGYSQGDIVGKSGIERQYDRLLRGTDGSETRVVDVRGRRLTGGATNESVNPVMGKNLVLSIDSRIQKLAEQALGERIGAVVVSQPSTGEILAMVSYPWYNPDIFVQNNTGAEYLRLINDPNKPLLNRAIQSSYPPASTFKVVLTTSILNENVFPENQTVFCRGELDYGNRIWRCHLRTGHGRLNLKQALAQSCDIYFWTVGRDSLGVERIASYANEYGFGKRTGIDLPGEVAGFIPTPSWKERWTHERWQNGDTMNMSIGQGYTLVTPLQMVNMVSMVVNDGVVYQPHILKEVRDSASGVIERTVRPEALYQSNVKKEVFDTVKANMRSVISEGTAQYPLNIRAVEIAGKTGTGEVGLADQWHSWFAGYAPYQTANPDERIAVSVIVEAANTWEWWAVYASSIIFQGVFANQSYEEAVRTLGFGNFIQVTGRRE
ncbi:MAG: penicillin-binding protein 2 [Spirochaetaceae bacterium]|jgi:penicillin-binding protein 2|nr:penicillin-binding protein 2 [Spirochaetaceae bacterium]